MGMLINLRGFQVSLLKKIFVNREMGKEKDFLLNKDLQELFLTNDLDYKYIIFYLDNKEHIGYFLENRINEVLKISIEKNINYTLML